MWSCYLVDSNFHNGGNYEMYLFIHNFFLEFREVLFGVHILLNTNSEKLNKYSCFLKSP